MAQESEQRRIGELSVEIDRTRCIGSGNCTKVAPDVFELDDSVLASFVEDMDEASIDREQLLEACRVCPVDALIATDTTGQRLVPED